MLAQVVPAQASTVADISITDLLAVSALVLAVVTLFLDVMFFVLTWRGQVAFIRDMNERQDRLTQRETELFGKMSEVLATVSERARIVQEQVDKQMGMMTDYVISRAQVVTGHVSTEIEEQIGKMAAEIASLSENQSQVNKALLGRLAAGLNGVRARVATLPDEVAASARQSMDTPPEVQRTVRMAQEELLNAFLEAARALVMETGRNVLNVSEVIRCVEGPDAAVIMANTRDVMNTLAREGYVNVIGHRAESPPFWTIELTPKGLPSNWAPDLT